MAFWEIWNFIFAYFRKKFPGLHVSSVFGILYMNIPILSRTIFGSVRIRLTRKVWMMGLVRMMLILSGGSERICSGGL